MTNAKANILAQLQKEILPLQGFKPMKGNVDFNGGLGQLNNSFPNGCFPLGAIHEFLCKGEEDVSASTGFIAGLLSAIMKGGGVSLWISSCRMIFPPALKLYGIDPEKIIFIDVQKEKEILWVMEEALKCEGIAGVIAETSELSFTASRRFQLAVEQSRVTGFIIRRNPRNLATACVTRWKITPLPTRFADDLPGLGFPRWNVELVKVRNGFPGTWQMEWVNGRFIHVSKLAAIQRELQRKTG